VMSPRTTTTRTRRRRHTRRDSDGRGAVARRSTWRHLRSMTATDTRILASRAS
jgi:hypothetical protein